MVMVGAPTSDDRAHRDTLCNAGPALPRRLGAPRRWLDGRDARGRSQAPRFKAGHAARCALAMRSSRGHAPGHRDVTRFRLDQQAARRDVIDRARAAALGHGPGPGASCRR